MNILVDEIYDEERDLYHISNTKIFKCEFAGKGDGESVLKECRNIHVLESVFDLRYPLWHINHTYIENTTFKEGSRAPMWYGKHIDICKTKIYPVKAIRECVDVRIRDSEIKSNEFGWKNKDMDISNSYIESEYAFLESKNMKLDKVMLKGKYSFQYVKNVLIENSSFDTKDAFWHSKNVTVKNSEIKGEYLGWFSDSLTLINCKIIGTQPLCYCKNLKLIDCEMVNADLSFEYSEVDAVVKGHIDSIKNPKSGTIKVDSVGEIIKSDAVMECNAKIILNH